MEHLLNRFCICLLLTAGVCSALAAAEDAQSQDLVLDLDADSVTFNRQTNLFEWSHPRIVQGNLRIEADESVATGDDFGHNTELRFTGHVKITVDTAVLESDSAVFTLIDKKLSRAVLEGSPASFTDLASTQQKPVQGGARKIEYDHVARTLRMSDDAWINKDQYRIQYCDLLYDFTNEGVKSGSTDCGELVHLRVLPKNEPPAPPADPPQ